MKQSIIKTLHSFSLLKTLYFNFRIFPLAVAVKLPVKMGRDVKLQNVHRGCIELTGDVKRFTVSIGVSSGSMFADQGTLVRFSGTGKMRFGNHIRVYGGCSLIVAHNGLITLGSNLILNQRTVIHSSKGITLGENVRVGWNCQIYDSNFHFIYDEKHPDMIKSPYKEVVIGNNVWIANSCTVAKGAVIPPFSMLASGSLANRDYSEYSVTKGNLFAGTPAKFVRSGLFRILNEKIEKRLFRYFKKPENLTYEIESDIDKNDFYKER